MAGDAVMLSDDVERYLSLRRTLGFRLRGVSRNLQAFARFATEQGDTHVRTATAVAWATEAPSPAARHIRLRNVVNLARFLHAEDLLHEVPFNLFPAPKQRPVPYIYTAEEIARLIGAVQHLRETYPLRRQVYTTLIGLIAATGLRVSEALDLRFSDVLPDGVLQIRRTKFGKSRLVPLHPTAATALSRYLEVRRQLAVTDDHLFLSAGNRRIGSSMVEYTFRRIRHLAGIAPARTRPPRIHDLRHTVATRALEQCPTGRAAVARHFVALATYLGHSDIKYTYWYLEATPELMTGLATAAEALFGRGGMTPIAPLITAFLREHMPLERGYSPHTCETYAYAFRLLLVFASQRLGIKPSQLCLEQIDAALVLEFLADIENRRGNCATTRNGRLAAINSFISYVELRVPSALEQARQIHAIPAKRHDHKLVRHLTMEEIHAILEAPDTTTRLGIRDRAMLHLCFAAGLRVSELVGLPLENLSLQRTPSICVHGKGRKELSSAVEGVHHGFTGMAGGARFRPSAGAVRQRRRDRHDPGRLRVCTRQACPCGRASLCIIDGTLRVAAPAAS